ncbi:MAG: putative uvsX [uncultured bacterium]|nr:MAG: putative uvsX [uncultured bacterium]
MEYNSPFTPCPQVKIMLNIGALLDIPTGTYIEGRHGEMILNGGLAALTGIVGIGNNFKSTVMHYMSFTAMSRIPGSFGSTYDTEVNVHEWHLAQTIARNEEFAEEDILQTGRWVITDKTIYSGNKWYEVFKLYIEDKIKNAAKYSVVTPFWNREHTGPLMMLRPTFNEMDSFTEFETDDVAKMQDDNELGESGANTLHMRQGLAKMRFLMEAPKLNAGSYNYMLMTAHLGKESSMQSGGGGREMPIQKLKHLKNGDKIKGVTDKFTFVVHNCWHCYNSTPLMQADGDGPLYPRDSDDKTKYDTDLNTVNLRNLRSKSGVSGMALVLVVSQTEGVLPSLTEFHHIKEMGRYGLDGNVQNYSLVLYPDVKLSRTTVRGKIDTDPKLRRALNILSEMCQMDQLWRGDESELLCTPKELYTDLIAMGYDWDLLLSSRGWWTIDNDQHPVPFLSTMDLLRIRKGLYFPYWMDENKQIKAEYIVKK